MNDHLHASSNCTDIIKPREKFSSTWYLCPARKWTIAWGHVRLKGDNFEFADEAKGEELLLQDCLIAENCIKKNVTVALNQNQFDALVSLVFNIGIKAFRDSTMLFLINRGHFNLAADQFDRWIHGGGRVLKGLVKRRAQEKALFLLPE